MSVIAARAAQRPIGHDQAGGRSVLATRRRHRALILRLHPALPIVFYLVLMGLLVVRFGHLPNYVDALRLVRQCLRASSPAPARSPTC